MKDPKIRVFLADDHPIVREGLRGIIDAEPGFAVVGEAADGRAALERIRSLRPDVAVLDIDMPLADGLSTARTLREEMPEVAVIFLTIHREEEFLSKALEVGARGYVLKDSAMTDIISSIRTVAAGEHYTSPAMTSYLVKRTRRAAELRARKPTLNDLTPSERRVLQLIADYKTSREIADMLSISYRTVETHRANICAKLDVHGSHALMKFALAHRTEL